MCVCVRSVATPLQMSVVHIACDELAVMRAYTLNAGGRSEQAGFSRSRWRRRRRHHYAVD